MVCITKFLFLTRTLIFNNSFEAQLWMATRCRAEPQQIIKHECPSSIHRLAMQNCKLIIVLGSALGSLASRSHEPSPNKSWNNAFSAFGYVESFFNDVLGAQLWFQQGTLFFNDLLGLSSAGPGHAVMWHYILKTLNTILTLMSCCQLFDVC
jgi:hypothetical protein